jgi:hypothetical protein
VRGLETDGAGKKPRPGRWSQVKSEFCRGRREDTGMKREWPRCMKGGRGLGVDGRQKG